MTGAANLKAQRSSAVNESIRDRIRATPSRQENTNTAIQNNPIYKLMFEGELSNVERKAEFAKFMTATLDREKDRANIKAYEEFREFLAHQNTALAQSIIELTNTKTFASLQKIIEDMNAGLMNFEDDLKPLMDIVDSIYQLRSSGVIYDAFREIEADREADEKRKVDITNLEQTILEKKRSVNETHVNNASLAQKRGFFGFGGITEEARQQIAANESRAAQDQQDIIALEAQLTNIRETHVNKDSNLGEMAVHKEKLRELLDLSSSENVDRMVKLRDSALKFVENSKESTTTIRGEFGTLESQLDNAEENNRKMTSVYAILNGGMKDAAQSNVDMRSGLDATLESAGDDLIVKMETEDKIRNLDTHSKMLHGAQGETINTYAELSQQAVRVGSMKESTRQQVDIARKLNTQGVSATADRLASVMTAVSGAAVGESAGIVEQTLDRMRVKTNEITQQEVIRNAMYVDKINNEMENVFAELETFRDTQRASSDIVREGLTVMNENMSALFEQTKQFQEEIKESVAIHTKLAHTGSDAETATNAPASNAGNNPFK